ncbi:glycosyltransferase family 9 protein [Gallaecimonas sp. GXIMD4217]|uniref:glycosyltransferase family 9 protein n=1 Tax=Gallaecimonas sp. GXIMD4217 TaxID=3131927 RepID=UPI00311B1FBB
MNSICILRLSAIGDVCHALALVNCLKKAYPGAEITWVVGKVEAQLLAGLEGVELVVFDKKQGLAGMRAVWRQLRGRRFDVLLHLQQALRASVLSLGIRARRRIGFNRERAGEGQWLFTNEQVGQPKGLHVLDNFMMFAEQLGIREPQPDWRLPVSDEDRAWAQAQLGPGPALVICPAASKANRNWLPERYAAVADWAAQKGIQVLLCGAPTPMERQLAADIQAGARHPLKNLVGQSSLKQLWALLGKADAVLGPDTGPVHMASSQGTATVGLYAHSNPRRTGPYNHQQLVVSRYEANIKAQTGRDWQQLPWGARAKGETLMAGIGSEEVIQRLDAIFAEKLGN